MKRHNKIFKNCAPTFYPTLSQGLNLMVERAILTQAAVSSQYGDVCVMPSNVVGGGCGIFKGENDSARKS